MKINKDGEMEFTEEEKKFLRQDRLHSNCKTCIYRKGAHASVIPRKSTRENTFCAYLLITGEQRECMPCECKDKKIYKIRPRKKKGDTDDGCMGYYQDAPTFEK